MCPSCAAASARGWSSPLISTRLSQRGQDKHPGNPQSTESQSRRQSLLCEGTGARAGRLRSSPQSKARAAPCPRCLWRRRGQLLPAAPTELCLRPAGPRRCWGLPDCQKLLGSQELTLGSVSEGGAGGYRPRRRVLAAARPLGQLEEQGQALPSEREAKNAEEPGTYGGDSDRGEWCSQGSVKGNDFNNYFGNTV